MFCICLVVDPLKFLVFLPILGENLGCTPFVTIDSLLLASNKYYWLDNLYML